MSIDTVSRTISTAMILAAGRGERLRPLTDTLPKPLVEVAGRSLLLHHLYRLQKVGIKKIVINHAYLGDQIVAAVNAESELDVDVCFSSEDVGALETAGGIIKALPYLGERFVVVNADIWVDYDFSKLLTNHIFCENNLAHLIMVDTPRYKEKHDFYLENDGILSAKGVGTGLTFSGISVMSQALFHGLSEGRRPLLPVLLDAMSREQVSGEYYRGDWEDVGTLERLEALSARLS